MATQKIDTLDYLNWIFCLYLICFKVKFMVPLRNLGTNNGIGAKKKRVQLKTKPRFETAHLQHNIQKHRSSVHSKTWFPTVVEKECKTLVNQKPELIPKTAF